MLAEQLSMGPSAWQRAKMESDGYVVIRRFFDAAEVARIASWTEALAAAPDISGRHWVYHEASLTEPDRRLIQPHQDQQAGWSKYAPLFLTAMVSIDPTTASDMSAPTGTVPSGTTPVGPTA